MHVSVADRFMSVENRNAHFTGYTLRRMTSKTSASPLLSFKRQRFSSAWLKRRRLPWQRRGLQP